MVRRLRTGDDAVTIPLVFMTYLNPIYVFGREKFFASVKRWNLWCYRTRHAVWRKSELASVAHKHGVEVVSLIAPTSENRIEWSPRRRRLCILCIFLGVTGMRSEIKTDIKSIVDDSQYTDIPVLALLVSVTSQNKRKLWRIRWISQVLPSLKSQNTVNMRDQALFDYVQSMKQAVLKAGA